MEAINYQKLEEREFVVSDFLVGQMLESYETAEVFCSRSRKKREKYRSLVYELYSELRHAAGAISEEVVMEVAVEFFCKKNLDFDMELLMLTLVDGQLEIISRIIELRGVVFAELQEFVVDVRTELSQIDGCSEDANTLNAEKALAESCIARIRDGSLHTIVNTINSAEIIDYPIYDENRELGPFEKFYIKRVYQRSERYGEFTLMKPELAALFHVTEDQVQKVAETADIYSLFGLEPDGGLIDYVFNESLRE